jgi:riboflavin kinase/FMN adenylyltransferase
VTVGVFDGVHVAHQRLIRTTKRLAERLGGTSVVVTFDPDPQMVLSPRSAAPALMPLEARVDELRRLGADRVWVIPFTAAFASMTAERFFQRVLLGRLRAVALVVGEAFLFGSGRRGDMALLRGLGSRHGVRIVSLPHVIRGGAPVSSSRIRELIRGGRLAQAASLLGRPPGLYGMVVGGEGRGRQLGFPTANIQPAPHQVLPPPGVYAVVVRWGAAARWRHGVMNFGVRPTFGAGPLTCEVYLPGFSGNLRGRRVSVSLLSRLRGERRFPDAQALSRQIQQDIVRAQRVFQRAPRPFRSTNAAAGPNGARSRPARQHALSMTSEAHLSR